MPDERPEGTRATTDLYRYSGLGLQFAATVGLFAWLGHWLDRRWSASPWCLLAGVLLGFALGLYSMLQKLPTSPRKRPPKSPSPP